MNRRLRLGPPKQMLPHTSGRRMRPSETAFRIVRGELKSSVAQIAGSAARRSGGQLVILPQHVDEGAKPGRHVAVTGIVEAQAREWRRPVFEHRLQGAIGEMFRNPEIADE